MSGRYALSFGRGAVRHALEARAKSLGYPVRLATSELLLITSSEGDCLFGSDTLLIGKLFDGAGERLKSLPTSLARCQSPEDLCSALNGHWGIFALFFASGEQCGVYREPSGSIPVYRCDQPGGTAFVSDAEFAARLGLLDRPAVDTRFVVHWLQFPFLRSARTGLEQVVELLPGMMMKRAGSAPWTQARVWHPSHFVGRSEAVFDPADAARQLRETALRVVPRQPENGKIVLRLSGGLDSSIIAACFANAGLEFSCINFATHSRDGDEREYARTVANSIGVKLIEVGEPRSVRLVRPGWLGFRPVINPLLAPFDEAVAEAAANLGASVIIDGGGGDNLFCATASAAQVIDALQWSGLREAVHSAMDLAARTNCTIWDVMKATGHWLLRRRPTWNEDRSFIARGALLEHCELHPWLDPLCVPPGKSEHVKALVHIQHFLDRGTSGTELLHPLLCQPLLELCLRIPSWFWTQGGRDRAIAREAFTGLVPPSVLQRRMKGSLQSLLYRSFSQLRGEMHELLRSGELARMGILEQAPLNSALTGNAWMTDEVQLRISEMVALELWLQSWRSQPTAATGS